MTLVEDRLYDADYYAWALEQAAVLRRLAASRVASDLDLANLAGESEDLGKSQRRAVRSQLRRLIENLLKLQYSQSSDPRAGWRRTVLDARIELEDDLTPTLRREPRSRPAKPLRRRPRASRRSPRVLQRARRRDRPPERLPLFAIATPRPPLAPSRPPRQSRTLAR